MQWQSKKKSRQKLVIKLTEEQSQQIKRVTGKLLTELKLTAQELEERANPLLGYGIGGNLSN